MVYFQIYESPVGKLFIYADDEALLAVTFQKNRDKILKQLEIENPEMRMNATIRATISQLKKYFSGQLKKFDLDLRIEVTDFQLASWRALQKIPFGKTSTYAKQAEVIKNAKAVRAVGATNSRNPLSIIIPCHRIVSTNGSLTGYSGGIEAKRKLLELESVRH